MKIFGALCVLRYVILGDETRNKEAFLAVDGIGLKAYYQKKTQLTEDNIRKCAIRRNEVVRFVQAENKKDALEEFQKLAGFSVGGEGEKKAIQLFQDTMIEIACDGYLHLSKSGNPVCGKPGSDDDLYGEIGFCVLSVFDGQRDEYPDSCPVFNDKRLLNWLNNALENKCCTRVTSFDRCTSPF